MPSLNPRQRTYLLKLAHPLKPLVQIGKLGVTDQVKTSLAQVLLAHELVKIKFGNFKAAKQELAQELAESSHSELVAIIGNTAILYRPHPQKDKRKIVLA